jgi:amylosucrase
MPGSPPKPDDVLFDLRLARSAPDLWPMLDQLYGARPDYAAFRARSSRRCARPGRTARGPETAGPEARPGTRLVPARRHGGLRLLHGPLQRHDQRRGGETGLPSGPWNHLRPLHALPEAPPRRQRRRLFGDGLPPVNPAFGTMDDFESAARTCAQHGISLCVDLVLNHTAKEHSWAKKAAKGDPKYQDYYLMFDTPEMPKPLRKPWSRSFPTTRPATSPITPRSANGSGPPSTNTSGT